MQTLDNNLSGADTLETLRLPVVCCRHAPFLIAFQERAHVFTTVVGQDRMEQREMGMREGYGWGRQFFVTIHRTTLLQVSLNYHSTYYDEVLCCYMRPFWYSLCWLVTQYLPVRVMACNMYLI